MSEKIKIGIIICDRYRQCAGGKCFRAMKNREGAFSIYEGKEIELVGYTSCDGCPGGNVEYTGDEMVKNGVDVIHLATGLVVGYPPCPRTKNFKSYLETKYNVKVVIGTHPIPEKYLDLHTQMGTWRGKMWESLLEPTMSDENARIDYN